MNPKLESFERWENELKKKVLTKEYAVEQKIQLCDTIEKYAYGAAHAMRDIEEPALGDEYNKLVEKANAARRLLKLLSL